MIELIIVIVLIGTLSVVAAVKWPSGMEERAAVMEFKRGVRHAQHYAMTRQYTVPGEAWGILVSGNAYTVKRQDDSAFAPYCHSNHACKREMARTRASRI